MYDKRVGVIIWYFAQKLEFKHIRYKKHERPLPTDWYTTPAKYMWLLLAILWKGFFITEKCCTLYNNEFFQNDRTHCSSYQPKKMKSQSQHTFQNDYSISLPH